MTLVRTNTSTVSAALPSATGRLVGDRHTIPGVGEYVTQLVNGVLTFAPAPGAGSPGSLVLSGPGGIAGAVSGATLAIPAPKGSFDGFVTTLNATAVNVAWPAPVTQSSFLLQLTQDAVGGRVPTLPAGTAYPVGQPHFILTPNAVNLLSVFCFDGATWSVMPITDGVLLKPLIESVNTQIVAAGATSYPLTDVTESTLKRLVLSNTASCAIGLPAALPGKSFRLEIQQDATGARAFTFAPAGTDLPVSWYGGATPVWSTAANKADEAFFRCYSAGLWRGQAYIGASGAPGAPLTPPASTGLGLRSAPAVGNIQSGTAHVIPAPSGVLAGDVIVIAIMTTDVATYTSPGFAFLGQGTNNPVSQTNVYTKTATASEPASYTFTSSVASPNAPYAVAAVKGSGVTAPTVVVQGSYANFVSLPSITAAAPNPFLLGFGHIAQEANGPLTASAGWAAAIGISGSGGGYGAVTSIQTAVATGAATPAGTLTPVVTPVNGSSAVLAFYA